MDVLTRLAVAALAALALAGACYSPQLHDCTVSCTTGDDCAGDQVCGSDRLCAMPDVAGKCAELAITGDAGIPGDAAIARPDAAPPDAGPPPQIALRVQIEGKGTVFVNGHGMCLDQPPQKGDCTFMIAPNVAQSVSVLPDLGQKFVEWTSMTCKGASGACTFTPTAALAINAKFDKLATGPGKP